MSPRDALQPLSLNPGASGVLEATHGSSCASDPTAPTAGPSRTPTRRVSLSNGNGNGNGKPGPSSSSSQSKSTRRFVPPAERKLAPIFTRRSLGSTSAGSPNADTNALGSLKRLRGEYEVEAPLPSLPLPAPLSARPSLLVDVGRARQAAPDAPKGLQVDVDMDMEVDADLDADPDSEIRRVREENVMHYFPPSTPTRESKRVARGILPLAPQLEEDLAPARWVVRRRRTGIAAYRSSLASLDAHIPTMPTRNYLTTLTHLSGPFQPGRVPQTIFLPSLHPPTGRLRDFAPPLACSLSTSARVHDAASARATGARRLLAVAGEEGGVRVIPVDETAEWDMQRGLWWRAHANAVFDVRWSADDTRLLTASGDQTTRMHAMDTAEPTLLASLRGHTSSVKTATFFDPTRGAEEAARGSVVATAGRDGHIMIYDLRCAGWLSASDGEEEGMGGGGARAGHRRDRYSAGIPGFSPQEGKELDPVMVIRAAHADGRRTSTKAGVRSVTTLLALQSMPGLLASGGATDGIVKLWDLRFAPPTTRHPDPRPSHGAAASLPDPTVYGAHPSRRARGINSIVESPSTGDLYVLAGDSRVHVLRPSAARCGGVDDALELDESSGNTNAAIQPESYTAPGDVFRVGSFYARAALDPTGRWLIAGNERNGMVAWDTEAVRGRGGVGDAAPRRGAAGVGVGVGASARISSAEGTVLEVPDAPGRGFGSVDWGMGVVCGVGDDYAVRIWRENEA